MKQNFDPKRGLHIRHSNKYRQEKMFLSGVEPILEYCCGVCVCVEGGGGIKLLQHRIPTATGVAILSGGGGVA